MGAVKGEFEDWGIEGSVAHTEFGLGLHITMILTYTDDLMN